MMCIDRIVAGRIGTQAFDRERPWRQCFDKHLFERTPREQEFSRIEYNLYDLIATRLRLPLEIHKFTIDLDRTKSIVRRRQNPACRDDCPANLHGRIRAMIIDHNNIIKHMSVVVQPEGEQIFFIIHIRETNRSDHFINNGFSFYIIQGLIQYLP